MRIVYISGIIFLLSAISGTNVSISVDTSRFILKANKQNFTLTDNLYKHTITFNKSLIVNSEEEDEDEVSYISSFNFSEKVNSFDIGNGLIGLHLVSFEAMKSGSAQAAAGRDLFLIYNPHNNSISESILDFGITKHRSRYMGCLFASTSHFILADINKDGLIDIGQIKEEMKCEQDENDMLSEVCFSQKDTDWYVLSDSNWTKSDLKNNLENYIDLPLIGIQINPIDFFAHMQWKSYDPKNWNRKSGIFFKPLYRKLLIEKENNDRKQ